jgi:hypothetical protein
MKIRVTSRKTGKEKLLRYMGTSKPSVRYITQLFPHGAQVRQYGDSTFIVYDHRYSPAFGVSIEY